MSKLYPEVDDIVKNKDGVVGVIKSKIYKSSVTYYVVFFPALGTFKLSEDDFEVIHHVS